MNETVLVDVIRTPQGRRNGMLRDWHPSDLASLVLRELVDRNGIDPGLVDDVIMGCVVQVAEQGLNIGRTSVLGAGWPESVPATTVDRQCGSSQQSVHFAVQGVMAGAYDIAVAAGVESMTRIPMGSSEISNLGSAVPPSVLQRFQATGLPHQGESADMIAEEYGFSRLQLDELAAESQRRATLATSEGRFQSQIVSVPVTSEDGTQLVDSDECIRANTTVDILGQLRPAFGEDGKHTAGNSSQIADGASAALVMRREVAERMGLRPRARFHSFALAGADPVSMLKGPIPATQRVLKRSGLSISDIDQFEVNEAFASVVLAWSEETGANLLKVNPNGGAIALGHPLGASGTRLLATLVCELERTGGRFGLQVMCEGGGMANAMVVEILGT